MTLLDYESYAKAREQAYKDYENRMEWARKMLVNISKAGFFSSDRTIREYNRDIWKLDEEKQAPDYLGSPSSEDEEGLLFLLPGSSRGVVCYLK